jgi:hypothetical protein
MLRSPGCLYSSGNSAWWIQYKFYFFSIGLISSLATFGVETLGLIKIFTSPGEKYWPLVFLLTNIELTASREVRYIDIFVDDADSI